MKYFFVFEPKVKIQVSSDEFNLLDKLLRESRKHVHVAEAGGLWHNYSQNRKLSGEINAWLSVTMEELEYIFTPLVRDAGATEPIATALYSKLLTISKASLAAVQKANNNVEVKEA